MARNNLQIRIGYISIPYFVGHDGKSWTGTFSTICELFHGWTEAKEVNRTLIGVKEGFGHFNHDTGKYSGLLSLLQRDEVDMVFDPNVDFNLVRGNGVTRGQLMECNPPAIISGYNSNTSRSSTDILMDTSRDIGYANLLLFFVAFTLLTHLLSKNNRVKQNFFAFKSVFHYVMQKIPIKTYNLRTIIISMSLTLTLFYLILSFSSLLHVSLVKFNPPAIVHNYEDIVERLDEAKRPKGRKFHVEWSGEYPDTELFRLGEKGSKENKIWERVVEQGGPKYVKLGLDMNRADKLIGTQSMVVILNEGYAYFVRHCLCSFNNHNIFFHSWVSKDQDAKWNQKGYVIRESLRGSLRSWVDTRTQRVHESGLMIYSDRVLKELKFQALTYDRMNCSSDVVVMGDDHDGQEAPLGHEPFVVTYLICIIILTASLITLICEKIYFVKFAVIRC